MFTVVPEPMAGDDRTGGVELGESSSVIDDIVREGARRMLAEALQAEVEGYIAQFVAERDENGWCAAAATSRARCSPAPARWR